MSKSDPQLDVLVLGEHPCAYLAAVLLKQKGKLNVLHAVIPEDNAPERLVLINPELFELNPVVGALRRKMDLSPVYGMRFVGESKEIFNEARSKSALSYVGSYKDVRQAFMGMGLAEGVETTQPRTLQIHGVDETGIDVSVGKSEYRPKALVVAGHLTGAQQKLLGMPDAWEKEVPYRYTFARVRPGAMGDGDPRPVVPLCLDLGGALFWAWYLPKGETAQMALMQPVDSVAAHSPAALMGVWAEVLREHGILKATGPAAYDAPHSLDLPIAGALAHEGVANRTLLIGPAGGFYSACAEDIYPNCWSAVFAAEVLKKSLKEPHLQDALQTFSHKWRTSLGEYLRGPQQNLRFLLPLVYRNGVMAERLCESILMGRSVVR
jgi:flavin-dependent dehydrogenase